MKLYPLDGIWHTASPLGQYSLSPTRSSTADEIANVKFFTTTSCTYYKSQSLGPTVQ